MPRAPHGTTPTDPPPQEPGWEVTVQEQLLEERGSFSHGVCRVCGWRGPGRRARRVARNDASAHLDTCPGSEAPGTQGDVGG